MAITGTAISSATNNQGYYFLRQGSKPSGKNVAGSDYIYSKSGVLTLIDSSNVETQIVTLESDSDLIIDTDTFYVDATNDRIGVGTTSPVVLQHNLLADDGLGVDTGLDSQTAVVLENSTSVWLQFRKPNNTYGGLVFNEGTDSDGAQFRYYYNGSPSASAFEFRSNGAEVFRIVGNGNVGIGKAPSAKLDINLATEDFAVVDAGSTAATEQDWIEVTVGGATGYIRVYATK